VNKATTTRPGKGKGLPSADARLRLRAAREKRRGDKNPVRITLPSPSPSPSGVAAAAQYSAVQGVAGVSRRPLRSPLDAEEEEKRQDEDGRFAASFAERWRPAALAVRPLRSAPLRSAPLRSSEIVALLFL